ncbi:Domain of uncharacterised function (DUF2825) [Corynebacterium striatum]|nr:Domain of uncharacterised function (DUF2825) [Corynebacterium striatum]
MRWGLRSWAHPRLRGADSGLWVQRWAWPGSSPLTRGGRPPGAPLRRATGLIPAYAGRTPSKSYPRLPEWAHPRLRGADVKSECATDALMGSSPLTRGGLPRSAPVRWPCGLIPAYAGRTGSRRVGGRSCGAHPRLRGADRLRCQPGLQRMGSSPLTRGGPVHDVHDHAPVRLIPAYAGRTFLVRAVTVISPAHPRLRGADPVAW